MEMVSAICAESQDLRNLLKNPIVKSKDKIAVLNRVFSGTDTTTQEFIAYLTDKRRENELPNVASQYISTYNEIKGIASATVVSATPLSEDAMGKMKTYVCS